jgi:hypothetical protein
MTAQVYESIVILRKRMTLACCPPLPERHPRIKPCKPIGKDAWIYCSTACWRGYRGTWMIRTGKLYLKSLDGYCTLTPGPPILADWVSGVLRIVRGEMLCHVHMSFHTVMEFDDLIAINAGSVTGSVTLDNRNDPDPISHDRRIRTAMPGGMFASVDDDWNGIPLRREIVYRQARGGRLVIPARRR